MTLARTLAKGRTVQSLILLCAAVLLASAALISRRPATPGGDPAAPALAQAREAYGRIPLGFEANRGQTDASVDFLARGAGYTLFLRPTEVVFALWDSDSGSRKEESAARPPSTGALLKPEAPHSEANHQSAVSNQQSKVLRMRSKWVELQI